VRKPAPADLLVPASEIRQGQFFKKRKGEYTYLRISESSVKWIKADPTKIYGVCFNGNITCVAANTPVEPCSLGDFVKNIDNNRAWHVEVIGRYDV
jgi:hypothetical protein